MWFTILLRKLSNWNSEVDFCADSLGLSQLQNNYAEWLLEMLSDIEVIISYKASWVTNGFPINFLEIRLYFTTLCLFFEGKLKEARNEFYSMTQWILFNHPSIFHEKKTQTTSHERDKGTQRFTSLGVSSQPISEALQLRPSSC